MGTKAFFVSSVHVSVEHRKLLVERVASSRYIGKSARLRALLTYLCDQVLEHGVQEIHEQEVGRAVFDRPADYDTASDNIVRVHASMLRKRLEQYFASEGRDEKILIELPKGNYAPVFLERSSAEEHDAALTADSRKTLALAETPRTADRPGRTRILFGAICVLACATGVLAYRLQTRPADSPQPENKPVVRQFWSQVFRPGVKTDIVLDDQGVGLYQELTGKHVALADYFNRNYLRSLAENPGGNLPQRFAEAIVLKRQSSYASTSLLWKISDIAFHAGGESVVHFARDYALRELTVNNAVLLGTSVSNPWVETFEPRLGLRWKYDPLKGTYYPVDTWAHGNGDIFQASGDGYASIALLPNLNGSGKVLIISSSGGSSMASAGEFLSDEHSLGTLESLVPHRSKGFSYFESLLRVKSRSRLAKDVTVVFCRAPLL
jgi:hypothetical protein